MNRDYSISFIRFVAINFVIMCHILEQSGYTVAGNYLAVGVQLFLLISGWLYSKKDFTEIQGRIVFIIKNFTKVLLDYYICVIFFFVPVYYVFQGDAITISNLYKVLTCSGAWWGIHHLWYVPYCLFCYLITPILFDLKQYILGRKYGAVKLLMFFAAAEIIMTAFSSYFLPSRIICYCIGYYLPLVKKQRNVKIIFGITAICAFVFNIVRYFYKYVWNIKEMTTGQIMIYDFIYNYACLFLGLFLFIALYFITRKIQWHAITKWILRASDKFSYDVYLVHMIFVKGCLSLIGRLNSLVVEVVSILLISLLLGIILHWVSSLIKKPVNKLFARV